MTQIAPCVGLALLAIASTSSVDGAAPLPFGATDFKQYYTASRLLLAGHNPYDYGLAAALQQQLGAAGAVQVPYGPPTSLLPFVPFGLVEFGAAVHWQLILNIAMLALSGALWGTLLFPRLDRMPLIAAVSVFLWVPTLVLLGMGHVSTWPLLGFTLWNYLLARDRPVLAGAFLALSIVKPHLALGLVVYAGVIGIRDKRYRMLMAFTGTVLVACVVTVLIRPTVWSEYLASLPQSDPGQWYNATLDGWCRLQLDRWHLGAGAYFRPAAIALALALLGWVCALGWRARHRATQGVLVLAICLCATPYAFSYDFVLAVPGLILMVGAGLEHGDGKWWAVFLGWIGLNGYALDRSLGYYHESSYFLVPWCALALTLVLANRTRPGVEA